MPPSSEQFAPGEEFLFGQRDYWQPQGQPIAVPTIDTRGGVGTINRDMFTGSNELANNPGGIAALQSMIADLLTSGNNLNQGGLSLYEQTRSMVGWVYVAIRAIRNAVAKTPLRSYSLDAAGKEKEILDPKNGLTRLLSTLNPMDTRSEFWAQTVTFYKLTGNAFWVKVRDGLGKIQELWVMPSQYLRPAFTREGLLGGYWLTTGVGEMIIIPAKDLVHFRNPNPRDRFWGWGDLSAAADAMKSQNAIKSAQLNAFQNDILASVFFQCEEQLTTPSWQRMMAQLKERYAGPKNAGKPLLMEGGVTANFLNRPPAEMAFKESSMFTRDEILSIFGVMPLIAGLVDSAYNTTDSQERIFEAYTIEPFLRDLAERINKDLVPEFGLNQFVRFDNPVAEDKKAQATIDSQYVVAGIIAPNEVRKRLGQPEEKWGVAPKWVIQAALQLQLALMGKPVDKPFDDNSQLDDDANGDSQAGGGKKKDKNQDDDFQLKGLDRLRNVQVERPSPVPSAGRRSPPLTLEVEEPRGGLKQGDRPGKGSPRKGTRPGGGHWHQRYKDLVLRAVDADYTHYQRETVPTLRKYFAKQAERIKENVERIFKPLLADKHDHSLTQNVVRKIFCVSGGGLYRARLFPDGSCVNELGNGSEGKLGRAVDITTRRYADGEWSRVLIRKLDQSVEDQLDDWEKAADQLAERMIPKLREAMDGGAALQNSALGVDFQLPSVDAEAWLRHKQRDYWRNTVNDTTKSWLSERLAQVMEDAPTIDKLVAAVNEVMDDRIQSSAETIARTETLGAYNAGANIIRKKAGVKQKEWVSTLDNRTRTAHDVAHGQVVKQDEQFTVDGEQLEYPGDPHGSVANIINCRCTSVAVLDDEDDDESDDE